MLRPTTISLQIASVPIRLAVGEGELAAALLDRYRAFLHPAPRPFILTLEATAPLASAPSEALRATRAGAKWRVQWQLSEAEFDLARRRGKARGRLTPFAVDSWLRVLLSFLLPPRGGLVLHAATLLRAGRAHVFLGRSGAGKTTLARLVPPAQVFTDEISLLRVVHSRARAYPSPFWGEFKPPLLRRRPARGGRAGVPLAGLYLLIPQFRDGRTVCGEPLPAARAVAGLCAHMLSFASEPLAGPHSGSELARAQLRAAARLLSRVSLRPFRFRAEKSFWRALPRA